MKNTRKQAARCAALVVVVVVPALCYLHTVRFGLVWDDRELVAKCPVVTGEMSPWRVFSKRFWVEHDLSKGDAYRPLTKLSFVLSERTGDGAGCYHAHSVSLHCTNALLLYCVLLACGAKPGVGAIVTLIAVCHPVQSEAVAYVKNRSELLCTTFALLCLLSLVYLPRAARRRSAVLLGLGSVLCYAAALLSRSTAVVLFPLAVGCAVLWMRGRARLFVAGGYLLVLALYFAIRPSSDAQLLGPSPEVALSRLGTYLRLCLWPVDLSAHHAHDLGPELLWIAVGSAIALAGLVVGQLRWVIVTGVACAALAAPALIGTFSLRPIAEQRVYSVTMVAVAALLPLLAKLRRPVVVAALVPLCCLLLHRAFVWQDERALWRDTLISSGHQTRPLTNWGLALKQDQRYRPALWAFAKAARSDANDLNPLYNAGTCHLELGQWRQAETCFLSVTKLETHAMSFTGLALARAHLGKLDAALDDAERAIELAPDSTLAHQVMEFVAAKLPRPTIR